MAHRGRFELPIQSEITVPFAPGIATQSYAKQSDLVLATDRKVQHAKPNGDRAEFRLKGAKNLVLPITANGAKTFTFLYASPTSGTRCNLALGTYPATGLAAAKDEALSPTVTPAIAPGCFRRLSNGEPVGSGSAARVILQLRDKIGVPGIGIFVARSQLDLAIWVCSNAFSIMRRALFASKHYNHAKHFEPNTCPCASIVR